jgi:hypothetical protein
MSKFSDDDIRQIFEQFDVNKDGKISRDEFAEAAKKFNIKLEGSSLDSFVESIDANKDGEISFDEFKYFVTFKTGAFKELDELLLLSSQSVAVLKKLASTKNEHTVDENSHINFVIKDKSVESADKLPTLIEVLGGDFKNHKELQRVFGKNIDHKNALIFVFKVENKSLVLENLPQYCEALKAVLLELGPDFKDMAETIEFDFVEVDHGVQLIIDLSKNPVIQAYSQASQEEIKQLENFPVELSLRLGTDFDLNNYHLENEQIFTHRYIFELLVNTCNLSTLMGVEQVKNTIKQYVEAKDFSSASFLISMLSMKSVSLEMDFDDKLRSQLKTDLKVQNKETLLLDLVEGARTRLEESGIKDFIDSMDFIKTALKDLKDAGLSELGIFIKFSHLHFGLNVKGNMYTALNKVLQIE